MHAVLQVVRSQRPAPCQDRSRRTEQALLDAALGLFRERGVEVVTVGDIAAAAQVAPATIYRRFGDKEGLVRAAFERFIADALVLLDQVPAESAKDTVALLADVAHLVMLFSMSNQRLLQSAYTLALVNDYYTEQLLRWRQHTVLQLRRHLLSKVHEMKHPEPELAIDFALRQAAAMISSRLVTGKLEVGSTDMSDTVFLRELMRSLLGYLQVPYSIQAIDEALQGRGL